MSGPGRAILAAVLLCSGCGGNWVNLSKNAAFDEGSDDAVVVLKANPLATFTILPGWTDRNGWAVVATLGDKYQINPVDGYIVLKLAPRVAVDALRMVARTDGPSD